jgi:hypothetical protein
MTHQPIPWALLKYLRRTTKIEFGISLLCHSDRFRKQVSASCSKDHGARSWGRRVRFLPTARFPCGQSPAVSSVKHRPWKMRWSRRSDFRLAKHWMTKGAGNRWPGGGRKPQQNKAPHPIARRGAVSAGNNQRPLITVGNALLQASGDLRRLKSISHRAPLGILRLEQDNVGPHARGLPLEFLCGAGIDVGLVG